MKRTISETDLGHLQHVNLGHLQHVRTEAVN